MVGIARSLFALGCTAMLFAWQAATPASAEERYIVSGASGQLGELVARELLRRGVPARDLILVSHTPEKLANFAKLGAVVRDGDVERPETLVPAYTGGTQMLLISVEFNFKEPRYVLHEREIDAAAKAGVKHIVYTSFIGAETDFPALRDHRITEKALRDSGLQWTFLRNGEYAYPRIYGEAEEIVEAGRAEMPPGERPIAGVSHEDCAAAAAAAMMNPAAVNQIYEVTGPALFTTADIARTVGQITGRQIPVVAGTATVAAAMPMPAPPAGTTPRPRGGGTVMPGMFTGVAAGVPVRTAAQLSENAARFKQLTGRDPQDLRQMLEVARDQLLKPPGAQQMLKTVKNLNDTNVYRLPTDAGT